MPSVCFCFQVHHPYRRRRSAFFDSHQDISSEDGQGQSLKRRAETCRLPTNRLRLKNRLRSDDMTFMPSFREGPESGKGVDKDVPWFCGHDHAGGMINLLMDYETFGGEWEERKGRSESQKAFVRGVLKKQRISVSASPGDRHRPVSGRTA